MHPQLVRRAKKKGMRAIAKYVDKVLRAASVSALIIRIRLLLIAVSAQNEYFIDTFHQ